MLIGKSPEPALIAGLLIYFFLQGLLRLYVSPGFELDEAEQYRLLFEPLSLGHGAQPPLYHWIFRLLNAGLGLALPSLVIIKAGLLFILYFSVYRTARLVLDARYAVACALSLALFPQYLWESQRDLTHSVLASAMVAVFWWALLRALLCPKAAGIRLDSLWPWVWVGGSAALALLSKYNTAVGLLAALLAALSIAPLRERLLRREAILGTLMGFAVALPHVFWVAMNFDTVRGGVEREVSAPQTGSLLLRSLELPSAFFQFALIWLLVVGLWFAWRSKTPVGEQVGSKSIVHAVSEQAASEQANRACVAMLLKHFHLALAAFLLLLVLAGFLETVKDRWLQPLLVMLPLWGLLWASHKGLHGLAGLSKALTRVAVGFLVACLLLMPGRVVQAPQWNLYSRLNIPFDGFVSNLMEQQMVTGPVGLLAEQRSVFYEANLLRASSALGVSLEVIPLHTRDLDLTGSQQAKALPFQIIEPLHAHAKGYVDFDSPRTNQRHAQYAERLQALGYCAQRVEVPALWAPPQAARSIWVVWVRGDPKLAR